MTVHEEDGVQDSLTFQRLQIMLLEQFGKYVIDINFLFCHHSNKLSNFVMISYQGYPLHTLKFSCVCPDLEKGLSFLCM